MLYSMTGFGRAVAEINNKKINVEIKSLNSKQMDLSVRLPHLFREQEAEIRNMVTRSLQRGKVEIQISVENTGDAVATNFNINAMAAYKKKIKDISAQLGIGEPSDWYAVLLRFSEVFSDSSNNSVAEDSEAHALMGAVASAIDALVKHRRAEGEKLEEFFATRINRISELLGRVPEFETERIEKIRARITDNLAKLSPVEYDKGRFEQEMIFYIEKLDINEEKQRLAQHLRYFIETMNDGNGGQGKKLGFISQEMGREINTLGSKSNHAEMQKLVVMMKDELEQIKEQVLNVM